MIIIHGVYRWRAQKLAFRRDYCRSCGDETMSVLVRTFNVIHVYWVPLVPLGFWSRWLCERCGREPHAVTRTRRGFKITLALFVAVFCIFSWVAPASSFGDPIWISRAVTSILLVVAIRWAAVHRPEPDFDARLATVQPYDGWGCPLCGAELVRVTSSVRCSFCNVEHRPL